MRIESNPIATVTRSWKNSRLIALTVIGIFLILANIFLAYIAINKITYNDYSYFYMSVLSILFLIFLLFKSVQIIKFLNSNDDLIIIENNSIKYMWKSFPSLDVNKIKSVCVSDNAEILISSGERVYIFPVGFAVESVDEIFNRLEGVIKIPRL